MKKIILLFTVYSLLFTVSYGQTIEWQRSLGGSLTDLAYCIIQTSDSGYLTAGYSYSHDGDITSWHDQKEEWVVKLDKKGNLQWQKCLGGNGDDGIFGPHSMIESVDGNYVLAGFANSSTGDVSGVHGFMGDYWVVKMDTAGNILWQKCLGGTDGELCRAIVQTFDGGYAVSGSSWSSDGDVSVNHGYSDYWLVKLDSIGTIQWEKSYGGSLDETNYSLVQTADSGFALCGWAGSNDGDVTGHYGGSDYWVVKTDNSGNIQWQKCFGGSLQDWGTQIVNTNDNGFIITGYSGSSDHDVTFNHGNNDIWVAKIDINGNLQWQKSLGTSLGDQSFSVLQALDGSYVVAGVGGANNFDLSGTHGSYDYWIINLDTSGLIINSKTFGGSSGESPQSIVQTFDGGYALTGNSSSGDGDVNQNKGGTDYWVVKTTNKFNSIGGKVFADLNSNQIQDVNEPARLNHKITETNTGRFNFSNQNGDYLVSVLDSGNFSVSSASINYYNAVPASHNAYFSGINQTDSLNDFAFQPAGVFNDLCITITPFGDFNPGFNASYMISYENTGTTTLSPTVIFFPDNSVTFVTAIPTASNVTTDSAIWNFGPLAPFQSGSILITVNVNAGTPIGALINSNARIEPVAGDNNPGCNYAYWEVYVTGSYDPNDIIVDEDTLLTTQFPNPPYLEYIIRFQNTGNATAFNVSVLNNIPQRLDINTFEFVASSHEMTITYGAHARLMTFTFDNINLPDSNINEPASHGFIRYRIKPKSNLVAGNKIFNKASIYFDFNEPVMTNTAVTEIVLPTGEESFGFQVSGLWLYPNPARDELIVNGYSLTGKKAALKIYDLYGREVFQLQTSNFKLQTKIDVSRFSQGIYFVELQSEEKLLRGKFLKE